MDPKGLPNATIDVETLSAEAAGVAGVWPLAAFRRLLDDAAPAPDTAPEVAWSVDGERRRAPDGRRLPAIRLRARASLSLTCQRCLQPLPVDLQIDHHFLFAPDENEAARLDELGDDDVLVLTRHLDLAELLEDEMILALPLVPRHEVCPEPLAPPSDATVDDAAAENPFAALAALRTRRD